MSVIALAGVPRAMAIEDPSFLRTLKSYIKGHFGVLNNSWHKNKPAKTVYLRLSEKLDPLEVVETLNSKMYLQRKGLRAFIPDEVPDFPLNTKINVKGSHKIPGAKMLQYSTETARVALLQELQSKYAGLYDLNATTGNKLLNYIAKIIHKRLQVILEQTNSMDVLALTKMYRKRHPHFADFQLVLSILHNIQDAEGRPRSQINEVDLTKFSTQASVSDSIPFDKVNYTYRKYLDKITHTVMDHIKNLDMTPKTTSPEEIARIKIREQLKTLLPYLPTCFSQATSPHFTPREPKSYTVHIYGEPGLPTKDSLAPFLKRHKVVSTARSNRIYNLVILDVPKSNFHSLLAEDGSLIGGAKLVIRPSNLPQYKVPLSSIMEQ